MALQNMYQGQVALQMIQPCTCHSCHASLDDFHQSIPSGAKKCPLDHWDGCKGGIKDGQDSSGKYRGGCPVLVDTEQETDQDSSSDDSSTKFHNTLLDDQIVGAVGGTEGAVGDDHKPDMHGNQEYSLLIDDGAGGSDDEDVKKLRELEASNKSLRDQFERQAVPSSGQVQLC